MVNCLSSVGFRYQEMSPMNIPIRERSLSIPKTMKAWVLDGPEQLRLVEKPVPEPGPAEVLVRIGAVAICGTDVEILTRGLPAWIKGGLPFNKNFTPGHEYMGTVVKLGAGVDEHKIGDRVAAEIHAGWDVVNMPDGVYTSCLFS
jgi:L-iditol 2-dehydrogenase